MDLRFRVALDALQTGDNADKIAGRHGVDPVQVAAWKRLSQVGVCAALASVFAVLWVANQRYDYPELLDDAPQPTMAHFIDPRFAGTTFQVEGVVESVQSLPRGLTIINLSLAESNSAIDVAVFPSLGDLPVKLVRGDRARVTGTLGTYRGRLQIKPLSVEQVLVSTPSDTALRLAEAAERVGETLHVGPLTSLQTEFFTSSANLRHLRLVLADPDDPDSRGQQGIMYEGDHTPCELDLLLSSDPFMVTARIETFQEAPSLVVNRVFPVLMPESGADVFLTRDCAAP